MTPKRMESGTVSTKIGGNIRGGGGGVLSRVCVREARYAYLFREAVAILAEKESEEESAGTVCGAKEK